MITSGDLLGAEVVDESSSADHYHPQSSNSDEEDDYECGSIVKRKVTAPKSRETLSMHPSQKPRAGQHLKRILLCGCSKSETEEGSQQRCCFEKVQARLGWLGIANAGKHYPMKRALPC